MYPISYNLLLCPILFPLRLTCSNHLTTFVLNKISGRLWTINLTPASVSSGASPLRVSSTNWILVISNRDVLRRVNSILIFDSWKFIIQTILLLAIIIVYLFMYGILISDSSGGFQGNRVMEVHIPEIHGSQIYKFGEQRWYIQVTFGHRSRAADLMDF